MRARTVLISLLCVLVVTLGVGCKSKAIAGPTEITDPIELERLWQEYFYLSIPTLGNAGKFDSAAEIDPLSVAEFCWFKYVDERGRSSLELAEPGSSQRLLPLDAVLPYAVRYFNLTSLDLSKLDPTVYDSQKRAFSFAMDLGVVRPAYNADNTWGRKLTKATRDKDGTVTVVLTETSRISGRDLSTMTYTMRQRQDSSLYFATGEQQYIDNHLVSLIGDYQRADGISGMNGPSMLGEVDGKLILANVPRGQASSLMLVDPRTMAVEKQLAVHGLSNGHDASLTTDGIIIRLTDRLIVVDKSLTRTEDVRLPDIILEKSGRDSFWGYDVSADRQKFVYSDETGVKLVDAVGDSERLLYEGASDTGTRHWYPRFVAAGTKVITTLFGHDGPVGYTLYDLQSGAVTTYRVASGCNSAFQARYDTGLIELNTYLRDERDQTDGHRTAYLDFATGQVLRISFEDPGDGNDRAPDGDGYVGQEYAAFVTAKRDDNDDANSLFYINRVNLNTLQVEPAVITVKAAETYIVGVLADGRVVFWYRYNPSENGVCITK